MPQDGDLAPPWAAACSMSGVDPIEVSRDPEIPAMPSRQAATKTRQFPTRIDIPADKREPLCELLNAMLADTSDLKSQTKQAHWNVKGKDFYQLHLLFDVIAEELEGFVDLIAERCTTLGGYATGTNRMAAENSTLPEYPTDIVEGMDHVEALVERFGIYCGRVRDAIEKSDHLGDASTADMFTEVSRAVDMRLWFLEAHIQDQE
jgi:starvation-inducible DNA-binding protein